jgi:hypothetical protein
MSNRELSGEARKGILILAGAVLLAIGLAASLFAWQASLSDRIAQQQAERDLVAARAAKKAREGAGRLTSADSPERLFLAGETPGLTIASFQELVGAAAARSGLNVVRVQPFESGDDDAKTETSYRLGIDAEGSLEQLQAFLVSVEAMLPLIFVTGLDIRPEAATDAAEPYPSEALRASIRVEAHGWRAQP